MRPFVWIIGLAVCLWPLLSAGATPDEFLVRTSQDYVRICSTGPSDPLYAAAMGFCHGFGVGPYQYYQAATAGPGGKPFICPPEPPRPGLKSCQCSSRGHRNTHDTWASDLWTAYSGSCLRNGRAGDKPSAG